MQLPDVVIDPKDIHLTGYQGAAQHTYTPACDGFHEPGQCPRTRRCTCTDNGGLVKVTDSGICTYCRLPF